MSKNTNMQTAQDVEERIAHLSAGYTPEWAYSTTDPDIGSTIAAVFARQTEENLRLLEALHDRYHVEFVNMLDLSLHPAKPAGSMVSFHLTGGGIQGTQIPKGTRMLASSDQTESGNVIFETDRGVYVTASEIRDVFMTDGEEGTISPIFGDFEPPKILDQEEENTTRASESAEPGYVPEIRPFVLFGERENIGRSALVLYHEWIFDDVGQPIFLRFDEAPKVIEGIRDGIFELTYLTEDGLKPFTRKEVLKDNCTILLVKDQACKKITVNDKKYAAVVLTAKGVLKTEAAAESIGLSASGVGRAPAYVGDASTEMDIKGFAPFTDTLALYSEFYIGEDAYLARAGARVTLTWKTIYRENEIKISAEQLEQELKVIKKKPRRMVADTPAITHVDEITLEYFNGVGWKRLETDMPVAEIFAQEQPGEYKISFLCPSDWQPSESGPYNGRSIRMRVMRADNCYLRPSLHIYPFIISYNYEGEMIPPDKVIRIAGTDREDITDSLSRGDETPVMAGSSYVEDALYIGLDKRMEEGPVSLYFALTDAGNQEGVRCQFEYSSPTGFKGMRVVDYTEDFTRSGIVMFLPPADHTETEIEHRRRFWLRVTRQKMQAADEVAHFLPHIGSLMLNVIPVSNVQTGEETDYFIDEVLPNMSFGLRANHILDAEVWVNEKGVLTRKEMEKMLAEHPERVRVEYDFIGRVAAFYVLWDETDRFASAKSRRSYRIDRITNRIHFSDGSDTDLPRVTDDIAFKVRVRSTDGEAGNVPAGAITDFTGAAPFIDTAVNPIRAFGGSNLESIASALQRGAAEMHARGRLVSAGDYLSYIMNYSDTIERAAVCVGETIEGTKDPADVSLILLMKDCAEGSFSFHRIAAGLKQYLLSICELTIPDERLHIVEPIFVDISVSVWVKLDSIDDSFEVQAEIRKALDEWLDPVSHKGHDGWEIGVLPKASQVLMHLNAARNLALVQRIALIAHYTDAEGEHETDVEGLTASPFMVCRSGKHQVYTNY